MTIGETWGSVRSILKEYFTFSDIKDLVGASSLPVHKLAHVQQGLKGYSKGGLLDEIDKLFLQLDEPHQNRFVTACIEEALKRNPRVREPLEQVLIRVGYGLKDQIAFPLQLQIDVDTAQLDEDVAAAVTKCLKRYRDGEFDGAITAICGAVDSLTEKIYADKSLGDHKAEAYQTRISRSFQTAELSYVAPMKNKGMSDPDVELVWNNHKKSISQAAYVLGAFRREYAHVHGTKKPPAEFVQKAIDCAVFILRSFLSAQ